MQSTDAYITEALIKVQMIDVIVPPSVLAKYAPLLRPFLGDADGQRHALAPDHGSTATSRGKSLVSPPFVGIAGLRSEALPLVYLEFKGFRFMMPAAATVAEASPAEHRHDLLMLQVTEFYELSL